jgi:hypothetical protein
MQSSKTVVGAGQAMLKELIAALCHKPELLTVEFMEQESTLLIRVCAHPTDARIIVGTGASHLKAVVSLARLLFWGSHKLVQIMPIESVDGEAEKPYQRFEAREDWQEKKLVDLMQRLAEAVFRDAKVSVNSIEENSWSSRFDVILEPPQNESAVKRFSSAIAILFVPIGCSHGRMIYANTRRK